MKIKPAHVFFDGTTGKLEGVHVIETFRKLNDIASIFEDQEAVKRMDLDQPAYRVEIHEPAPNAEGGLLFGTSYLCPGKVGNEYFMTKGHFHEILNRAEYYWGISGEGILLTMDQEGKCCAHAIKQGTLHYIPGDIAHRLVNTGNDILTVGACWPADSGHDYATIEKTGFSCRVKDVNGKPTVVTSHCK